MMKIAFILQSTYNAGGMERMLSTIANALVDRYTVTVISAFNAGRKDYFPLSSVIRRVDLGLDLEVFSLSKGIKTAYKEALSRELLENHQDVCVSLGSLEFLFLPDIKDGSKKFFWFHFALNFDLFSTHPTRFGLINKCLGYAQIARRIRQARKYDKVVVISKEDLSKWQRFTSNVVCIYNPVTISNVTEPDYEAKRAIAVGRLHRQKGFDYLIDAWKIVHSLCPEWQLDVMGDGPERDNLQKRIYETNLGDVVHLCGNRENIAAEYSKHSIAIMSSRYEGFGLVLVEAAVCGLPLVSYACQSGPSEIIKDGYNGTLIHKVGDVKALAASIVSYAKSVDLRREIGQNAQKESQRFLLSTIVAEWEHVLTDLVN